MKRKILKCKKALLGKELKEEKNIAILVEDDEIKEIFPQERLSEYENIELATKRIETRKQGVQPAVDEFLESSDVCWTRTKLMNGEPIMLSRVDIFNLLKKSE